MRSIHAFLPNLSEKSIREQGLFKSNRSQPHHLKSHRSYILISQFKISISCSIAHFVNHILSFH